MVRNSRENMSSCSENPLPNRLLAESKYLDARPLSLLRLGGLVEEGRSSEDKAVIFADFISSSFTQSAGKLSTGPLQVSARQDTAVATAPLTTVLLAGKEGGQSRVTPRGIASNKSQVTCFCQNHRAQRYQCQARSPRMLTSYKPVDGK